MKIIIKKEANLGTKRSVSFLHEFVFVNSSYLVTYQLTI